MWVGEDGIRCYGHGLGETHRAFHLLRQAELVCDPRKRESVVRRMYQLRFDEVLPEGMDLNQIRGKEGARIKQAYSLASRHTRGGGPYDWPRCDAAAEFSPHAWGWTGLGQITLMPGSSFPHTRGGGPPSRRPAQAMCHVFPTRVGVDRSLQAASVGATCSFPHTRGGGPARVDQIARPAIVFPTRVGVDRSLAITCWQPGVFPTRVGVDRWLCAYDQ